MTGLPCTVLLELSLLVDAGCNVRITTSFGTDVGDVGEAELEELVHKPGTYSSAIFDELWFLTTGRNIRDLRRVFRVTAMFWSQAWLALRIRTRPSCIKTKSCRTIARCLSLW